MSDYPQLLSELPSDWSILFIEEIGEVISGGTPSRSNPRYWGGEIPWVTPGEVTGLGRKCLEKTDEKITTEGLVRSGAKLLPPNSLLITTRASLGAAALNAAPATTNQGFKSIAFTKDFSADYYYHWSTKLKDELVRLASGTTFLEISGSQFRKICVPAPPHAEQLKIACILDTLDTQIQKTEALIAKLEKVKEGLLHDLLTRGIDENGQLRPSPEQAAELYKESPLGLIPREWGLESLGQCLSQYGGFIQTGPFGSQLHAEEYVNEGVPVVMPQYMRDIEVSKENIAQITEERARDLSRHRVSEGDLLYSRRGDLSRCSFMSESNEGWLCGTGCLLLRPTKYINGYWLANIYKQPSVQSQVYGMAVGSTMVNLNSEVLANIIIPIPSLQEQDKVADAIRSFKKRLLNEVNVLNKLKLQKTGLMNDLLTGHVRVTPLLDQAQTPTPA
ncbi:type I restriction enzyme, S subunit [Ectothiorhodospira magna]|uniref:Type I restriction enzyme, S subunit n=1 Tax=Ectothiorhodospira magna TaxID=867345 RepID=A0A1H9CQV2_9GAMM|nr:restriction endonuclease subunit S [Ectothiorhodospira magna]SEQ02973.1 type I restriction enzyme, S subunit [Ectothiorhodospira magna]